MAALEMKRPPSAEAMAEARHARDELKRRNPDARFAIDKNAGAVGAWVEIPSTGFTGFLEVLVKSIVGGWVWLVNDRGIIQTTRANGQPLYSPDDWIEPTA